jgi:hypothetical protein
VTGRFAVRTLADQVANLHSAHVAALEVTGRLGSAGVSVHVHVDAQAPLLDVHVFQRTHDQAVEIAALLGLDSKTTTTTKRDILHQWFGEVADFPVRLTRTVIGGAL